VAYISTIYTSLKAYKTSNDKFDTNSLWNTWDITEIVNRRICWLYIGNNSSWKETLNYFVQQKSHKFTQRLHGRWYYKNDGIFQSYSVAYANETNEQRKRYEIYVSLNDPGSVVEHSLLFLLYVVCCNIMSPNTTNMMSIKKSIKKFKLCLH
jgi:hypothetical protein